MLSLIRGVVLLECLHHTVSYLKTLLLILQTPSISSHHPSHLQEWCYHVSIQSPQNHRFFFACYAPILPLPIFPPQLFLTPVAPLSYHHLCISHILCYLIMSEPSSHASLAQKIGSHKAHSTCMLQWQTACTAGRPHMLSSTTRTSSPPFLQSWLNVRMRLCMVLTPQIRSPPMCQVCYALLVFVTNGTSQRVTACLHHMYCSVLSSESTRAQSLGVLSSHGCQD